MRMTTTFIAATRGHQRAEFARGLLVGPNTKVLVLPRSRRVQLGIEKTAQMAPTNGTGHAAAVRRAAAASPAVGSTRARSIGANAER
jgi:hypothetical protein